MTGKNFHGILVAVIMTVLLLPVRGYSGDRNDVKNLPLSVRLVLNRVNPILQKKEYLRAAKTLLTFQARGNSTKPGQYDSKGYHHPEIYFVLGNCYLLMEQYASAAEAYRQAVARDETHTSAWLNLAKSYYESGRYTEAGRCFEKGYESAGGIKPEHLYYSAAAFLMAGDPKRSIQIFERLLAFNRDAIKPEWKENLVHALLTAGRPRQALPFIAELARIYTGEKKIQWQEILLYQYVQLEKYAEALRLAMDLTQEAPMVAKWWKALAHIHLNRGRLEDGIVALTIYAFLAPLSPEEKRLFAGLHLQLGIPIKAAPIYEDILKHEMEHKRENRMLYRLTIAYRQLGKPETALKCIEKYGKDNIDADILMLKGELLYELKRYGKAAEAFRSAVKRDGKKAGQGWLMAGYAAMQVSDFQASMEAFKKAAGYLRHQKAATEALRHLDQLTAQ